MRCTLPSTRSAAFYAEQEDFERSTTRGAPSLRSGALVHASRTLRSSTCLRVWSALTRLSRWRATAYVLPAIVLQSATCSIAWRLPIELAISSTWRWLCYRLVPRGEESGSSALEEMQGLMNEMGVSEPPTFEEAVETIHKAGLELPPVPAVTNQLADAAVQLVDNGFFSWHAVASSKCGAPWATMSSVPLNRSLGRRTCKEEGC